MPVGESGRDAPHYGGKSVPNNVPKCEAIHLCAGGVQGVCDSAQGHGGRHTCESCQELFSVAGEPGSDWCLTPCPRCDTRCRRRIKHTGRHVCDYDHSWGGQEMTAAGVRAMEEPDEDFSLPLPPPKGISSPSASRQGVRAMEEPDADFSLPVPPLRGISGSSAYRPQDAGDGVDHWHCAHCNTQIPLNSSVCSICRYKICNSCSEVTCPKTAAVRPRGGSAGTGHRHCAHCGVQIP